MNSNFNFSCNGLCVPFRVSVQFFFQSNYTDDANLAYLDKYSHRNLLRTLNQITLSWDGPFSKLCSIWSLLLKIEISFITDYYFILN